MMDASFQHFDLTVEQPHPLSFIKHHISPSEMILIRRVTVAFLHLSKDTVILFIPIFSSLNNTDSTTVILSKQSV